MTRVYLYALCAVPEGPRAFDGGSGIDGGPVRLRPVAGMIAAVGTVSAPPVADAATLRAHDVVVRRLAAAASAVVPMRFGQTFAGEAELDAKIAQLAPTLRAALARVDGCEQRNIRLLRGNAPDPGAGAVGGSDVEADEMLGPGTRFLRARAAQLGEISALRASVGELARAERVQRARAGQPFVATVYHLVRREDGDAWSRRVAAAAPAIAPLQLAVSGPHPPYAFAGHEAGP